MYRYPILLIAHIGFWLMYAAVEHLSHLLYGHNHWQGSLMSSLIAMFSTGILALTYERIRNKSVTFKILSFAFASLLIIIIWHNITRILHLHITFNELIQAPVLSWFEGSAYRILLILTWAGLFISAFGLLDKRTQKKELALIKSSAKEAQLQQLMYQLNPHFLFNVLNSVDVAILEKNNDVAHQMVIKLSRFLRNTLEHKFHHKIQLKQELTLLDDFIEIEQQRFHQKIQFHYHTQPDVLNAFLPPLILQPLMENAIKFSWNLSVDCHINFEAVIKENRVCLSLSNSCSDNKNTTISGTNTGLKNVRERLMLLYGADAQLSTSKKSDEFTATIVIPLELSA